MIRDARNQFLSEILSYQGKWPATPRTQRLIDAMSRLEVGDAEAGQWKILKEILEHPAECPSCHKPPQWGFYLLQEMQDGHQIQLCGRCLADLAGPEKAKMLHRYWNYVGGPIHEVSEWRDLVVGMMVWMNLHPKYQNTPGTARDQWERVKYTYQWYMRHGYILPIVADNMRLIIGDTRWDMVVYDKVELKRFASGIMWSPEQRMLADMLQVDLYRHAGKKTKAKLTMLWKKYGHLSRPQFTLYERAWIKEFYDKALRGRYWERYYGDRDS
jgi:hypothetical protein